MMEEKAKIYTDGAARGNPGKAGWGAIIILQSGDGEKIVEIGGSSPHATNNQMELSAAIESLRYLRANKINFPLEIFSDSKYLIMGITEWIFNWQKNNWRNAGKKPVLNKELWEKLFLLTLKLNIKWFYVAGHKDDQWNNRADEIATSFADGIDIKLRDGMAQI